MVDIRRLKVKYRGTTVAGLIEQAAMHCSRVALLSMLSPKRVSPIIRYDWP